jgi:hypothetical protein
MLSMVNLSLGRGIRKIVACPREPPSLGKRGAMKSWNPFRAGSVQPTTVPPVARRSPPEHHSAVYRHLVTGGRVFRLRFSDLPCRTSAVAAAAGGALDTDGSGGIPGTGRTLKGLRES